MSSDAGVERGANDGDGTPIISKIGRERHASEAEHSWKLGDPVRSSAADAWMRATG